MLQELFSYLTTRCSVHAKKFGHLYESISLIQRESRCHLHWQDHVKFSKEQILFSTKKLKNTKRMLILGSGPLHEIPIEELSEIFENIDLVDAVHLKTTKKKYRDLSNLNFIEYDITETEQILLEKKEFNDLIPKQMFNKEYDFVLSANVLSQLSIHLKSYLHKNLSFKFDEVKIKTICRIVTENHYSYLLKFNCPTLMITDVETHYIDPNDNILQVTNPPFNFEQINASAQWWWNVAPIGEISRDYSMRMKVCAFNLNFPI